MRMADRAETLLVDQSAIRRPRCKLKRPQYNAGNDSDSDRKCKRVKQKFQPGGASTGRDVRRPKHVCATAAGLNPKFLAVKAEVLKLIGQRKGVKEGELRSRMGNNPDTSKALRTLHKEGALQRSGQGGRLSPFTWQKPITEFGNELQSARHSYQDRPMQISAAPAEHSRHHASNIHNNLRQVSAVSVDSGPSHAPASGSQDSLTQVGNTPIRTEDTDSATEKAVAGTAYSSKATGPGRFCMETYHPFVLAQHIAKYFLS